MTGSEQAASQLPESEKASKEVLHKHDSSSTSNEPKLGNESADPSAQLAKEVKAEGKFKSQ